MKKVIIQDRKTADDIRDTVLGMLSSYSQKPIFKQRDLPGFGYEIFGTKKDKTEEVIFRLKLVGPPKYRQMQMEYKDGLVTGI